MVHQYCSGHQPDAAGHGCIIDGVRIPNIPWIEIAAHLSPLVERNTHIGDVVLMVLIEVVEVIFAICLTLTGTETQNVIVWHISLAEQFRRLGVVCCYCGSSILKQTSERAADQVRAPNNKSGLTFQRYIVIIKEANNALWGARRKAFAAGE